MNVFAPLLIGFAFGWLLQKAGLSRYERIVEVFRFRDLTVLKFLLSALITGAIGMRLLQSLDLAAAAPMPSTYLLGNAIGGVVFGVGMALSGFCPGTIAAGAGEGRLDNLIPGALGLYAGAVVYGLAYERWMPALSRLASLGPVTAAELLHVEPWLVVVLFAELGGLVLCLTHGRRRGSFTARPAANGRRPSAHPRPA